jgi:hypothetical protein
MRKKLAAGDLFQRSRVKNGIHTLHSTINGTTISHISDVIADPVITQIVSERVLFFLVTRNYSNFFNAVIKEIPQHGLPKGSRATSYQNTFWFFALHICQHSFPKTVKSLRGTKQRIHKDLTNMFELELPQFMTSSHKLDRDESENPAVRG